MDFVYSCHKKFRLLGIAKMGNTKYSTSWGDLSVRAILGKLSSSKQTRCSRCYHIRYVMTDVKLGIRQVRLFFCRGGKADGWRILLTTDTSVDFMRAYKIYAMRWVIEVFFADSKRLLGLADCSARDSAAQLVHVSLVMIRYNLLASLKRSLDYETIGGLFKDVYAGVYELTVVADNCRGGGFCCRIHRSR